MLKNVKVKKLDEKFSLLEEKLIQITKCPVEQKSDITSDILVF